MGAGWTGAGVADCRFLLPACAVLAAPAALHDGHDPVWARVLVVLAGVLFASGFVGVFSVALFNRPKRVVPPNRRAELDLAGSGALLAMSYLTPPSG